MRTDLHRGWDNFLQPNSAFLRVAAITRGGDRQVVYESNMDARYSHETERIATKDSRCAYVEIATRCCSMYLWRRLRRMSTQSSPITSAKTTIAATLLPIATATALMFEAFEAWAAAAGVGAGDIPDVGLLSAVTVGAGPLMTVTEGI